MGYKKHSKRIINLLHEKVKSNTQLYVLTYMLFYNEPKQEKRFLQKKPIDFRLSQLIIIEKYLGIRLILTKL